jgi:hypothetical protein
MKSRLLILASAIALIALASCTSYMGPGGYVPHYTSGQVKTVTQSSVISKGQPPQSTYDDEFVYDAKGNVIKHKQTEYFTDSFDKGKFITWETEFKVVGDVVLPNKVSCNGVTYLEVDYDLLPCKATGEIHPTTTKRYFSEKNISLDLNKPSNIYWNVTMDNFPVDFKADGKFIKALDTYSYYTGFGSRDVLTLGYDNIVLTKYFYSYESLMAGMKKSYSGFAAYNFASNTRFLVGAVYDFKNEWQVVNGKICQTKATFYQKNMSYEVSFVADMKYNAAGDCSEETWTAAPSKDPSAKSTVIFKQTYAY